MKFTIMGFSQEKLKELDLDLTDALIIRWFVDFKDSGSMATEIFENDKYYWIKYEYLLEEIPLIKINNKKTLGRRLKSLSEKGVLKQYVKRKGGIFTFYTLGKNYKLLISNNLVTQKSQGYTLKSHKGSDSKVTTKDSSIKDINLLKDSCSEHLTEEQIEKLEEIFPDIDYIFYTEKIKSYAEEKGKSYKDYYRTILNWARKDVLRNGSYDKVIKTKINNNEKTLEMLKQRGII